MRPYFTRSGTGTPQRILVFPFFLFIVGTSIVFAYQNKKATAATYRKLHPNVKTNWAWSYFWERLPLSFPFIKDFAEIRFPGVLQRIGVVFFFAAILFLNFNWKALLGICMHCWLDIGYG